ncbi:MAG: chemotaxis protein MotB [Bdellovibrionales bacterium]|nr:chemotaxis protein MotB [Bdellovibrionales bacterium]
MAEKEPIIVVKKITIAAAGAHGGSWKVAFADFMTAMMAFFLLMWLLGQSDQVKKNVSDYFSTPSVIEYNFSNYGVELTLEKLFLDLINEPLKVFQEFSQPVDYTPNFLQMGSKNIVMAEVADQLGDFASNMSVNADEIILQVPERVLFKGRTADPSGQFADVLERVKKITSGLEEANVYIDSRIYRWSSKISETQLAAKVAEHRLDLVVSQIQKSLEHSTVDVFGKAEDLPGRRLQDGRPEEGFIKLSIKQKSVFSDGTKPRKLGEVFGSGSSTSNIYHDFAKKVSDRRDRSESPTQR